MKHCIMREWVKWMQSSNLLLKSQENRDAADLLESRAWYNAATSRLYYALYQMILHILSKNNMTPETGANSHERTILKLAQSSIIEPAEKNKIIRFSDVRRERNRCDYEKNHFMNDVKYGLIKNKFSDAENVLRNKI